MLSLLLLVLLSNTIATTTNAATYDYDVCVYGSSPAGIAAAVSAASLNLSVALFEPLRMIGGMGAAGNLALNDGGVQAERTGLARRFSLLNGVHYYGNETDQQVPHPESFVANASFYHMLEDAKVKRIQLDCHLLTVQVNPTDPQFIASITLSCQPNRPVSAKVFIDTSYDGDIMVAAGNIDYTFGREATTQYNETLAGARVPGMIGPNEISLDNYMYQGPE